MPVHLLPRQPPGPARRTPGPPLEPPGGAGLTRRAFLGRAACGAAALLLPAAARGTAAEAAGVSHDPARGRWALLADTHIHERLYEKNRNSHMAANLVRAVSEALDERAGTALVNGDVARLLGNPGDYARFLEIIEPLRRGGVAVHATLGNHDDRSSFRRALASSSTDRIPAAASRDAGALPEKHWASIEVDGARWILLDSLETVNATPGLLGKPQLDWAAAELDRDPATPAIIFLHHNPETTDIGLKDTADLLAVLRPRRQVKAVFFGHTHTWRRWEDDGIHMVNLPATGYSFRADEPIGWVLARPSPDGLEIELRSIGPAHRDDRRKIALPWRKG